MNERIEELLQEAHRQTKGGIYSGHPSEWTEKFAVLIVKECAKIAFHYDIARFDRHGMNIGFDIEKHFGIESHTIKDSNNRDYVTVRNENNMVSLQLHNYAKDVRVNFDKQCLPELISALERCLQDD